MMRAAWLLALLLIPAAQAELFVSWEDPVTDLDVSDPYTATFLVTDEAGQPVDQAIVRLTLPDGSRVDFQELITNQDGITFATLVHDEIKAAQFALKPEGRIVGAEIIDETGPTLTLPINFTRADVSAEGDPRFLLAGQEAFLDLQATWAHDGSPIRASDPTAPGAPRFVVNEDGVTGLKQTDGTGHARLPFLMNETGLRLFEVGFTNTPRDIQGVHTDRGFIAWVDEETLQPEVIEGTVQGAREGVVVRVSINSSLNDHWTPLTYRAETDASGYYRIEGQYARGDDVLVYVVGDARRIKAPEGNLLRVDLEPAEAPVPGADPDLPDLPPEDPPRKKWWMPGPAPLLLAGALLVAAARRRA